MRAVPEAVVGIGTVLTPADVAPGCGERCAVRTQPGRHAGTAGRGCPRHRFPLLPGIATASELMAAMVRGFDTLKFFPAGTAGGIPGVAGARGPVFRRRGSALLVGSRKRTRRHGWRSQTWSRWGGSWLTPAADIAAKRWGRNHATSTGHFLRASPWRACPRQGGRATDPCRAETMQCRLLYPPYSSSCTCASDRFSSRASRAASASGSIGAGSKTATPGGTASPGSIAFLRPGGRPRRLRFCLPLLNGRNCGLGCLSLKVRDLGLQVGDPAVGQLRGAARFATFRLQCRLGHLKLFHNCGRVHRLVASWNCATCSSSSVMRRAAALAPAVPLAAFCFQRRIRCLELLDVRPQLALARGRHARRGRFWRRDRCWPATARGGLHRRSRGCVRTGLPGLGRGRSKPVRGPHRRSGVWRGLAPWPSQLVSSPSPSWVAPLVSPECRVQRARTDLLSDVPARRRSRPSRRLGSTGGGIHSPT